MKTINDIYEDTTIEELANSDFNWGTEDGEFENDLRREEELLRDLDWEISGWIKVKDNIEDIPVIENEEVGYMLKLDNGSYFGFVVDNGGGSSVPVVVSAEELKEIINENIKEDVKEDLNNSNIEFFESPDNYMYVYKIGDCFLSVDYSDVEVDAGCSSASYDGQGEPGGWSPGDCWFDYVGGETHYLYYDSIEAYTNDTYDQDTTSCSKEAFMEKLGLDEASFKKLLDKIEDDSWGRFQVEWEDYANSKYDPYDD